jgi:hypothetical protein
VVIFGGFFLVLFVLPGGRDDESAESTQTTQSETTSTAGTSPTTASTATTATTTTVPEPGPAWEWDTVTGGAGEIPDAVAGRLGNEFVTMEIASDGAWLWHSTDGLVWEREAVPALGGLDPSHGLVSGATLWVRTVSDDFASGTWWTTTDGVSWTEAAFELDIETSNVVVSPGLNWGGWGFGATSDAGARSGTSVVVPGRLDLAPDAEAMFGPGARLEWEWDTFEPAEYRVMVEDEAVENAYFVRSVEGPTVTVEGFRLPADGADPGPAGDASLGRASVAYPDPPEGWQGGDQFLPADFEPLQGLWVSNDGGSTFRFLAMPAMLGTFVSPIDVAILDGRFFTMLFEGMERSTTSVGDSVTATGDEAVYRVASSPDGWNWEPGSLVTLDADAVPRLLVLDGALLLGSQDGWLRSNDGERWDEIPLPGTTGQGVQAFGDGLVGFGVGGSSVFSYSRDLEHWATIPNPPGLNIAMCEALVVDGTPIWIAPGIRQIWVAHPAPEVTTETGSAATD